MKECLTETTGNEIDALRSATRKNNFRRSARINKLAHHFTGCLVAVRSLLRKVMHPAVHISVYATIHFRNGVDNTLRFLSSCGIIEINQRTVVHQLGKYGKIFSVHEWESLLTHFATFTFLKRSAKTEFHKVSQAVA